MPDYKNLGLMFVTYLNFQLVCVIHKGQPVLHAMIIVCALVMLILAATNAMNVLLNFLLFLHVKVNNTITYSMACLKDR